MAEQTSRNDQFDKLVELIKDIRMAMLTTVEDDGSLHSRPMATQDKPEDGVLWFFTYDDTPKTDEIRQDRRVNLSYAKPDKQRYVSVSGTATIVRDRAKMKELWNPIYKTWFPEGLDDPKVVLLRVDVDQAQYWDGPGFVGMAIDVVRSLATGTQASGGQEGKLEF